jgi:glucokinase
MLLLAGDIGGTKTILRLVEISESESKLKTLYEERYASGDFADLVPMVQQFIATAKTPVPEKACFAIAGPVVNDTAQLTNLTWALDARTLERQLGIAKVSLINDFAAVGYGVLGLESEDLLTLQPGQPKSRSRQRLRQQVSPIAIIGAGTGLGHCYLIPEGDTYRVFSAEGGHVDFAPRSEMEFQLLQYLLEKLDLERISVERVVSGPGIVSIYQFLRDRLSHSESPAIASTVRNWERDDRTVDPAAAIATAALENSDRLCEKTMQIFISAYGAQAGNFALQLLPYSGLYIAGGIAPKILPLMQTGSFLQAFTNKGRMKPLLESIPVQIVLNPKVGLIGAAIRAWKND